MTHSKRLLIVAYAFPPSGGAGVRRILKTVKYLAESGWQLSVLTPKRGRYFAYPYDPALLETVPPSVHIARSFTLNQWLMTNSVAAGEGTKSKAQAARGIRGYLARVYKRIYKHVGNLLSIPDSGTLWLPWALWRGLRTIQERNIEAILVTAPPFSSLLVAGILKRLTGLPLIVEFRDAWTSEPTRQYHYRWQQKFELMLEGWAIRSADQVISVIDGVTNDFIQRYATEKTRGKDSGKNRDKFITIPNGFDRSDVESLPPAASANDAPNAKFNGTKSSDATFNIVYTGTLGGYRTPKYFLEAIRRLLQQRPELGARLSITFVGRNGEFQDGLTIEDYVREFGLQENVKILGFVSREESLQYQAAADLLLVLVGVVPPEQSKTYGLAAKVFDYALSGKPVLVIAEEGATADFVKASRIGEVVSHYDQNGIAQAVERAMTGQLCFVPNQTVIEQYDYARLVPKLEAVLLKHVDRA